MFLIFNTIIDIKARDNFTNVIAPRIIFGHKYKVIALEDKIPDIQGDIEGERAILCGNC